MSVLLNLQRNVRCLVQSDFPGLSWKRLSIDWKSLSLLRGRLVFVLIGSVRWCLMPVLLSKPWVFRYYFRRCRGQSFQTFFWFSCHCLLFSREFFFTVPIALVCTKDGSKSVSVYPWSVWFFCLKTHTLLPLI